MQKSYFSFSLTGILFKLCINIEKIMEITSTYGLSHYDFPDIIFLDINLKNPPRRSQIFEISSCFSETFQRKSVNTLKAISRKWEEKTS